MGFMKNWSVEHTRDVKKWLDVDSYRKFEELPLIQLYHELLARTLFFKPYHEEFEAEAVRLYIDRIFTGKPFLITEKHLGYLTREDISLPATALLSHNHRTTGTVEHQRSAKFTVLLGWE